MLALDNLAMPLSFVAGPAILTNVCAILQNGVNIRHSHSVDQWRRFQAWLASDDGEFGRLYAEPTMAVELSERRVCLQLRTLEPLLLGTCVFGLTCFLALGWALAENAHLTLAEPASIVVMGCGATGLGLLGAVAFTIPSKNRRAHRLMLLHPGYVPVRAAGLGEVQ
ncbi:MULTISPECIES: hypothetical protein [unclassified Mesorhizobium]|uniref:hypothetical protein n=1 Tax=unclassified Mesorhizobium TaxID=325217 RepID=UPI0003CE8FFF|nr:MULTISPECIES: hypothetical protein [unclassified Mesorhizobium]ESY20300.1 hypothetical protein X751_16010 [Mesorhizobium sp. LNJC395A00]WJI76715.1 hypothetical protein NLY37_08435 [Mesorhizobium sp. C395A]